MVIVLWVSYIELRPFCSVVKMSPGKYLPVHSGLPVPIPSSPPIKLTPVSAVEVFLTGAPFASQRIRQDYQLGVQSLPAYAWSNSCAEARPTTLPGVRHVTSGR